MRLATVLALGSAVLLGACAAPHVAWIKVGGDPIQDAEAPRALARCDYQAQLATPDMTAVSRSPFLEGFNEGQRRVSLREACMKADGWVALED